jgi:hypothetical protein
MNTRMVKVIGVVAVVVAVGALLLKMAQARNERRDTDAAVRTPSGEPDLQGIWADEFQTPFERPAKYANKEFLTDEERSALDKERAAAAHYGDVGIAPKGTEQDVAAAYNTVFFTHRRTGRRTSMVVDPPDGRIPPLTVEAQRRRAEWREYWLALMQPTQACKDQLFACKGGKYGPPSPRRFETPPLYVVNGAGGGGGGAMNRSDGPEDRGPSERCLGASVPEFGGMVGGAFRRIVQSPGVVMIYYDTNQGQGLFRVIHADGSPHLPSHIRQWEGDSRGRWEGDTLVVDVTNFTPKTDFRGSRENLHLVERWRRADAKTIEYTVTIEDPTTWTRPWTVKQEFQKQNDQMNRVYYEPRCHEGNFGMIGLLAGMRKAERDFADGKGPNPATLCTGGCGSGIEDAEDADSLQ